MSKPILGIDVSKLDLTISLLIDKNHYHTKVLDFGQNNLAYI
ncbi:hypothetical protein [Candidatus Tisiphia endosymbiont of Metellina segmentata]